MTSSITTYIIASAAKARRKAKLDACHHSECADDPQLAQQRPTVDRTTKLFSVIRRRDAVACRLRDLRENFGCQCHANATPLRWRHQDPGLLHRQNTYSQTFGDVVQVMAKTSKACAVPIRWRTFCFLLLEIDVVGVNQSS